MKRRTQMLVLMLTACCPATWAADLAAAQVAPMTAQLRTDAEPLDRQVAALQRQVATLQAQLNALLSAVRVTETGVVLQGPAVTIMGGTIDVKADGNLLVRANDLTAEIARNATVHSTLSLAISSSAAATLQAGTTMDLRASVVRFNGGSRPVATVGSGVHTAPGASSGQIVTGSQTVLAD